MGQPVAFPSSVFGARAEVERRWKREGRRVATSLAADASLATSFETRAQQQPRGQGAARAKRSRQGHQAALRSALQMGREQEGCDTNSDTICNRRPWVSQRRRNGCRDSVRPAPFLVMRICTSRLPRSGRNVDALFRKSRIADALPRVLRRWRIRCPGKRASWASCIRARALDGISPTSGNFDPGIYGAHGTCAR
jgi:hypothetical protein